MILRPRVYVKVKNVIICFSLKNYQNFERLVKDFFRLQESRSNRIFQLKTGKVATAIVINISLLHITMKIIAQKDNTTSYRAHTF